MDNMINLIERHTDNLEELVEDRTKQLMEEKKKTDKLLYKILPRLVKFKTTLSRPIYKNYRFVFLMEIGLPCEQRSLMFPRKTRGKRDLCE